MPHINRNASMGTFSFITGVVWFYLVLITTCLCTEASYSQVRIQSKISIDPGSTTRTQDSHPYYHIIEIYFRAGTGASETELRVLARPQRYSDGSLGDNIGCMLNIHYPEYSGGEGLIFEGHGWYTFEPHISDQSSFPVPVWMDIRVDGKPWGDGSWCDTLYSPSKYLYVPVGSWGQWDISIPLLSSLDAPFPGWIKGKSAIWPYYNGSWIEMCYNEPDKWWSPMTEPISMEIIEGQEYAWFQLHDNPDMRNTAVSGLPYMNFADGGLNDIELATRSGIPDSVHARVVIRSSTQDFNRIDTIQIVPQDTIYIRFDPPTLSPGDTANVILEQRVDGVVSPLPSELPIELGIVEGCEYGKLVTLDGEGSYFPIVHGPVKFVADSTIDSSNAKVVLRLGLGPMAPPCKINPMDTMRNFVPIFNRSIKSIGDRFRKKEAPQLSYSRKPTTPALPASDGICDLNQFQYAPESYGGGGIQNRIKKLKIIDHGPWMIWPYLPNESNGRSRGADLPGYQPWRPFTIEVCDANDRPLAGEAVTIQAEYVIGTGGHQHNSSVNQSLATSSYGLFFGKGGGHGQKTFDLTTNSDGRALIDSFSQSQFSGKYLIKAFLKSDPSIFDTVNLEIKVPLLINYKDLIVAERDKYYIFDQSSQGRLNHPLNSWCSREMADSLLFAIFDFYYWSQSEEGEGAPVTSSLNDLSLPWGGDFDYFAPWASGLKHSLHRCGRSVDMNNTALLDSIPDPTSPSKKSWGLTERGIALAGFFTKKNYERIKEESIHFELNPINNRKEP